MKKNMNGDRRHQSSLIATFCIDLSQCFKPPESLSTIDHLLLLWFFLNFNNNREFHKHSERKNRVLWSDCAFSAPLSSTIHSRKYIPRLFAITHTYTLLCLLLLLCVVWFRKSVKMQIAASRRNACMCNVLCVHEKQTEYENNNNKIHQ